MSERRAPEETICPWLAMAAILKWGSVYEPRDDASFKLREEVKCSRDCQMYNEFFQGCGLRMK